MATGSHPLQDPDPIDVHDFPQIGSDDIVIAVMGITGCGKTTFINYFSDYPLMIGHGLESCTEMVQVVPCKLPSGKNFFLVDTPGFDDTFRSDSEILREIALWLNAAHKSHIKLAGIIYLHRIADVRIRGAGVRNIKMFKKLCGDNNMASVVLATTMWEFTTTDEIGKRREQELKEQSILWKTMIEHGSKVFRQDREIASATTIIEYLMARRISMTLDIQHEMVDQKLQLGQTGAGAEVTSEIEKQRQRYERKLKEVESLLLEALEKKDGEETDCLQDALKEFQLKKKKRDYEAIKMQDDEKMLHEEMKTRYEKQMEDLTKSMAEKELKIQAQVASLKENHAHELDMQKLRLQKEWKEKYYKAIYGPSGCSVM
ncbi:hypothetical protein P280DRAFT_447896 [Massarina eburnea CBS 473.64]|uniref:G domain-containing protein n=1 Tax=Massarina eburnea CBS 473.64 TaxID=1395130 RepID=A0A6A6S459_9PLEO|nr:hypothetical protein P280DRAFT_447896 [Massarina eburnea CBS 473.64]